MSRNAVKMSEDDFKNLLKDWSTTVLSNPKSDVTVEEIDEYDYSFYGTDAEIKKLENYVHNAMMTYHNDKSVEKIRNDLSKVIFDWENFEPFELGFWTTESGIPVVGCMAGGDWECPVHFVLYPENDKTIRAYIPKDGNTWNFKTKTAYGSEEENGFDPDPKFEEDGEGPEINIELFKSAVENRLKVK